VLYLASAQQEQCGSRTIGNSDETAATASRAQMFYLDTANPAPCTGNITSWRVCYYGSDSVDNRGSYWATYAIYRRAGSGNSVRYMRVSEMFRAIRTVNIQSFIDNPIVDGVIVQGGFNCYTDSIDVGNSPLTIQTGDILGACVFDPSNSNLFNVNRLPLDVVGEVNGESLLHMGTDGCDRTSIPSDISTNQLLTLNSRRLHIYAYIGKLYMNYSWHHDYRLANFAEREPITTQAASTPPTDPSITGPQTTTTIADTTTTQASQTSGPTQSSPMTIMPSPVTTPASVTEGMINYCMLSNR
jgi:hypothetical protein